MVLQNKFRIWDDEKKDMFYSDVPNRKTSFYNDEVRMEDLGEGPRKVVTIVKLPFKVNEHELVMDYIGWADVTGKDIYEGDIVENYAFKGIVVIDRGVVTVSGSMKDKWGIKQPLAVHKEVRIVGHVHEEE